MKINFDGQEIELPRISANHLVEVEEKFGSLAKLSQSGDVPVKLVRYLAFLLIKTVKADITEEQVGDKLYPEHFTEIVKALQPAPKLGDERPLAQS